MENTPKLQLTLEQLLIAKGIKKIMNEWVGDNENHYLDYHEAWIKNATLKMLEDYIYEQLMSKGHIQVGRYDYLEKKHIRFQGTEYVKNLIHTLVVMDYLKCDWMFPHIKPTEEELKIKL